MNKKLSMAVAGAVMAFGASAANAGITIPAGDWTIDIGGNVNAFYTRTNADGPLQTNGDDVQNIRTGLLPSAIGFGGKTRQNDLDVAFQFTFFVGGDDGNGGLSGGGNSINIRQAFLSFGDKSWGTIKAGRDLGIFGSDAILSDMTLLGVGVGATGNGGSSTLGRIGSGYIYADWNGQISYASPNWNGFSFAVGLRDNQGANSGVDRNDKIGFEGKVNYDWTGDFSGKVWAGFITQKQEFAVAGPSDYTARGFELGGKVAAGGFGLVAYGYDARGLDSNATTALLGVGGIPFRTGGVKTDDKGGYLQGTFVIPGVGTKLGLSYGVSDSEQPGAGREVKNKSWIAGAYHPLTKSLNLVAEYTDGRLDTNLAAGNIDYDTVSLGAIMFF
ncbi:MAG TPA: porin [Methylophilaceae bacterium]|nr:porin [Methylophilaceae bacterium]